MAKFKFYAVAAGRVPGIYTEWFGPRGAEAHIRGFPGARFKGFVSRHEAEIWLRSPGALPQPIPARPQPPATPEDTEPPGTRPEDAKPGSANIGSTKPESRQDREGRIRAFTDGGSNNPGSPGGSPRRFPVRQQPRAAPRKPEDRQERIQVFTDGGSIHNPGPGGYGVVILEGKGRREFSGGFRRTTNNRMELMGCIVALSRFSRPARILLRTDSQYVVNGIMKGWAKRWRERGWMRNAEEAAENSDLWEKLLELTERHDAIFEWIRGHAGHPENERCDELARAGSAGKNLPPDTKYEERKAGGRH